MALIEVGGHTIDDALIGDGVIIDVGCRSFNFANHFPTKKVYCIDPDEMVFAEAELNPNHVWLNLAISDEAGETTYYPNGEATMIRKLDPDPTYEHIDKKYSKTCKTITMEDLYKITGENVDILKLDCEGGEYLILGETFMPVPKQVTVEFHNHCVPETHAKLYPSIIERMLKDYDVVNDPKWERRHGCPENWWDVLFVRKW